MHLEHWQALLIYLATFGVGIGLIVWAHVNPKWQSAESYDALTPFIIGVFLTIAGAVYSVFSIVIFVKAHWHG
ncbi:hypothetical protein [Propionivibrio dicarboxylicus]|uniref:Uncharacterized protein n=1 Tax=Propionivibrio dicarboxylicus TaxID=83767 RepID=A0A1G8LB13_9RHOO|nr:hypothetical protein [Propionivibrio dicarboxylicus]SDI52845.1 hypothetical protein SAMN05660652_03590 [Propionivibrio dicarboxylicus]